MLCAGTCCSSRQKPSQQPAPLLAPLLQQGVLLLHWQGRAVGRQGFLLLAPWSVMLPSSGSDVLEQIFCGVGSVNHGRGREGMDGVCLLHRVRPQGEIWHPAIHAVLSSCPVGGTLDTSLFPSPWVPLCSFCLWYQYCLTALVIW